MLVVGVVGVGGLEEVELGVALVVGDDAALELGPVLGDEDGGLLDDGADVGQRVDDADRVRVSPAGPPSRREGGVGGAVCCCLSASPTAPPLPSGAGRVRMGLTMAAAMGIGVSAGR